MQFLRQFSMINIGFDFDNTIISYEDLFYKVGKKLFSLPENIDKNKSAIKDYLIKENREIDFTELQGLVYGREINRAFPTLNFLNMLGKLSTKENINIYIVSHKTKYPYRGEKIDLRRAATNWIELNLGSFNSIKKENIFYENTISEKIERVKKLNCLYYFDDLPKIIKLLPQNIKGYLYDPKKLNNDQGIKKLHDWNELDLSEIT